MLNPTPFQAKEEKVKAFDDSLSEADWLSEMHPLSEASSSLLMTNGRVLSRDALFESVWGASKDADLQSRTIDVHIRSLRNKLGAEGRRIFTVRNVGYRLDPAPTE